MGDPGGSLVEADRRCPRVPLLIAFSIFVAWSQQGCGPATLDEGPILIGGDTGSRRGGLLSGRAAHAPTRRGFRKYRGPRHPLSHSERASTPVEVRPEVETTSSQDGQEQRTERSVLREAGTAQGVVRSDRRGFDHLLDVDHRQQRQLENDYWKMMATDDPDVIDQQMHNAWRKMQEEDFLVAEQAQPVAIRDD